MTPIAYLDKVGSQVRAMQQRQPALRWELGGLWAADAAVRAKLRKLDTVTHMMRAPCGDVVLRFADGGTATGKTIWEALA